ncbi:MAG TPA: Rrf2 family transcriptional regulator [Syntrophomonadaceae bacterium]|nr:Rrf2 family transcriptional regulator [Syntrophomonadaceae bacterium]
MNINQATDYGFRAVLFLAQQSQSEVVEAQIIAQSQVVPMRFLLKIMPSLIKAGIVRSQRGIGGGYALARDPRDISLLDILEAIEGPIYLNRCLIDEDLCTKQGPPDCKVHLALADIQERLNNDFSGYSIADLMG